MIIYGSSDLSQVFSWLGALYGGQYILNENFGFKIKQNENDF